MPVRDFKLQYPLTTSVTQQRPDPPLSGAKVQARNKEVHFHQGVDLGASQTSSISPRVVLKFIQPSAGWEDPIKRTPLKKAYTL